MAAGGATFPTRRSSELSNGPVGATSPHNATRAIAGSPEGLTSRQTFAPRSHRCRSETSAAVPVVGAGTVLQLPQTSPLECSGGWQLLDDSRPDRLGRPRAAWTGRWVPDVLVVHARREPDGLGRVRVTERGSISTHI